MEAAVAGGSRSSVDLGGERAGTGHLHVGATWNIRILHRAWRSIRAWWRRCIWKSAARRTLCVAGGSAPFGGSPRYGRHRTGPAYLHDRQRGRSAAPGSPTSERHPRPDPVELRTCRHAQRAGGSAAGGRIASGPAGVWRQPPNLPLWRSPVPRAGLPGCASVETDPLSAQTRNGNQAISFGSIRERSQGALSRLPAGYSQSYSRKKVDGQTTIRDRRDSRRGGGVSVGCGQRFTHSDWRWAAICGSEAATPRF